MNWLFGKVVNMRNRIGYALVICLVMVLAGCGQPLVYTPAEIKSATQKSTVMEIVWEGRRGSQSAFYVPPKNPANPPAALVVVYPGITARALDWLDAVMRHANAQTGFLLPDYPGRGNSEGRMRPKHLNETSFGALKALGRELNISENDLTKNLGLLGHSFGCGAALQFASVKTPDRIVMVAPFTNIQSALFRKIGPLACFVPDKMDNEERLSELCALKNPPKIVIIHGESDESIPVEMGRRLAESHPDCVVYHEISGGDHTKILETHETLIFKSLAGN